METKKYIAPGGWFSLNYPASWSEFEDEEGSFLFYNPICWTGNFRISAYRGNISDFGMESLKREVKENGAGTQIQNLNGIPCVYRKEPLVENGGRYTVHYWLAGMEDVVFECTFTAFENAPIDEALDTISSLELRKENKHYKAELIPVRVLEIFEIDEAFYRVTEMVKKTLSIDFQGQENDLDHLQLMLEQAPLNLKKRNVWTMVSIVLCTILANEADGWEWRTLIDGKREAPVLVRVADNASIDPSKLLWEQVKKGERPTMRTVFAKLTEIACPAPEKQNEETKDDEGGREA